MIRSQIKNQVYLHVRNQVQDQVRNQVQDQVRYRVDRYVYHQVRNLVLVLDQVDQQVQIHLKQELEAQS